MKKDKNEHIFCIILINNMYLCKTLETNKTKIQ